MFHVTHPFLPQRGEEYRALERRRQSGVDIVIYREAAGQPQRHIPVAWTDLAEPDPWVDSSKDSSPFLWPDLLQAAALVRELGCQGEFAGVVKEFSPDQKSGRPQRHRQ